MYRARLQDDLFWDILQGVTAQYGTPDFHPNEEATSRYISAYFNKIISLFSGILLNTPDVLLESETTKPGQIKYQYTVGGAITVLFIEVPYKMGHVREQLDYFGQVITERIACSFTNSQNGLELPITAILCDGKHFQFFEFTSKEKGREQSPRFSFSLGKFDDDGSQSVAVASPSRWNPNYDTQTLVLQIRSACEALYFVSLRAYRNGPEACWNHSVEQSKAEESIPIWRNAIVLAERALEEAMSAWTQYKNSKLKRRSQITARKAVRCLTDSVQGAPLPKHELLPGLTKQMAGI